MYNIEIYTTSSDMKYFSGILSAFHFPDLEMQM